MNRLVNAFVIYQFLKLLVLPFEKTKAYKLGIIDKDGKYLKKQKDLKTSEEKLASNIFTRLVFNIRKLLMRFPTGTKTVASLATALYLIKEEAEKVGADGELLEQAFNEFMINNYGIDYTELLKEEKEKSNGKQTMGKI
tara:strand:+ start:192 stop:608 length:417 start_codon:yes stop_codon:yes gene_type:complete